MNRQKIAIIGAGISGIILAQELNKFYDVEIFEKSRGVGGRISTRRDLDFTFDHGAQTFCIRTKAFAQFLAPLIKASIVAPWQGNCVTISQSGKITPRILSEEHFTANPTMNNLCKYLAQGLDIKTSTQVATISKNQNKWHLQDDKNNNLGEFDFLISTAPPVQTLKLLENFLPSPNLIESASMQPCFALMIGFNKKINLDWIFAKVENSPIKLISVNSSKAGRSHDLSTFVIHSKSNWAAKNIARNIAEIQQELLAQFEKLTKINCKDAAYIQTHLWRYALVKSSSDKKSFCDFNLNLAATGDWACGSRIEDVFLAAKNLSNKIISYDAVN
jgi:renalase